jgi:hypothetical protein
MGVVRCFATTGHKRDNTISTAIVFIPNNLIDWQIKGCIEEEITQTLGLHNDVHEAKYTKFNDSDTTKEMTVLDWFLFKILYHPKMKAGMNKEQVKAVFDSVYDELVGAHEDKI